MSTLDGYIAKEYKHYDHGHVKVLRAVQGSRTLVEVEILKRGPGWDPVKKKYLGVKLPGGWMRGENKEYGLIDIVHIKDLVEIIEQNE